MQDFNILPEKLLPFIKSFSKAIVDSIKSRFSQSNLYYSFLDSDDVKQEWEVAKYYIKQIRSQNAAGRWEYIFNTYPDFVNEFPNIAKLVKISLIIFLSNAQVERIFSQHKLTKTRLRINIEILNKHLIILLNGSDNFRRFDWNKAYDYWAMKTHRSN
ncbi:unnamed protein product [Rhizophagus irregularis]|nr:unnamed protein product [Rhizophagus irregularis]